MEIKKEARFDSSQNEQNNNVHNKNKNRNFIYTNSSFSQKEYNRLKLHYDLVIKQIDSSLNHLSSNLSLQKKLKSQLNTLVEYRTYTEAIIEDCSTIKESVIDKCILGVFYHLLVTNNLNNLGLDLHFVLYKMESIFMNPVEFHLDNIVDFIELKELEKQFFPQGLSHYENGIQYLHKGTLPSWISFVDSRDVKNLVLDLLMQFKNQIRWKS